MPQKITSSCMFLLLILCTTNCPTTASETSAACAPGNPEIEKKSNQAGAAIIEGWYTDTAKGQFVISLDNKEKHAGTKSVCMKSIDGTTEADKFANLSQGIDATAYRGKHFKMSAWVKSELNSGSAQPWVRVAGQGHGNMKRNCYDNMNDRPIKGKTDWKQYSIVVDVPQTSSEIDFGCILASSNGKVWLDDVTIESVAASVPLTGNFTSLVPTNLNFEAK